MKTTVLAYMKSLSAAAALSFFAQGCGTIVTLSNVDEEGTQHGLIYSGVRFDYRGAFDENYMQHLLFLKPFCVLDMPLSFAADTTVLPYTAIKGKYKEPPTQ